MQIAVKIILLFSFIVSAPTLAQADSGPEALLFTKKAYPAMLAVNSQSGANADTALGNFKKIFNFAEFYKRCASDLKRKVTKDQLDQIETSFRTVFFKNFKEKFESIYARRILRPTYSIKQETENYTIVTATGKSKRSNITISFYLKKTAQGQWQLIDLAVKSALLSRNYRGSFNRIYREHGFDGLYARITQ